MTKPDMADALDSYGNRVGPDELTQMGVLAVCQELHMSLSGSSDVWYGQALDNAALYLRQRRASWKPSAVARTAYYDATVCDLIQAVLDEYDEVCSNKTE